jgi:hypothetical protein
MKNILLCFFAFVAICLSPVAATAGFVQKKQTTLHAVTATGTENSISQLTTASDYKEFLSIAQQHSSPSSVFVRWVHNGTISTFSLLFGILGFFAPIFSLLALFLGFIGMKRFSASRGLAVMGFVLGALAIFITLVSGTPALPIF